MGADDHEDVLLCDTRSCFRLVRNLGRVSYCVEPDEGGADEERGSVAEWAESRTRCRARRTSADHAPGTESSWGRISQGTTRAIIAREPARFTRKSSSPAAVGNAYPSTTRNAKKHVIPITDMRF